jgi:hypothetical protein
MDQNARLNMKRVYVAGPYTQGDVAINVRNAYAAADQLANAGIAPFVPHHTHFWHLLFPRPYEEWLKLDLAFLPSCDALLRLPGASNGADGEVAAARALGIPVFTDAGSLIRELTGASSGKKVETS